MWIYLTRSTIFSAVRKVYLSVLFLHFSLSVQLNHSWDHHLDVMSVSITQWRVEIGIFHNRFSRVFKSQQPSCNTPQFWYDMSLWNLLTFFLCRWWSTTNLKDFALIRADNPHNCKTGRVSIYFKEQFAVRPVSPLNLNGCLVLEINSQNKNGFVISLYWSPNQSKDEFDQFPLNLEQLMSDRMSQNPHFILVTGDLNVRSSFWKNDLKTSESDQIDVITLSYGLSQLICEPTHILPNSPSFDLIFINQNNFIMGSGVHASLHPNCHHQRVYAKTGRKNWTPTPTPPLPLLYERLVWDYNKTNTQLLNCTIETFNWEKLLEDKNVNDQLHLFNKTMLNIFHNFISNKNIICNDKIPLGLTNKSKHWLKKKSSL